MVCLTNMFYIIFSCPYRHSLGLAFVLNGRRHAVFSLQYPARLCSKGSFTVTNCSRSNLYTSYLRIQESAILARIEPGNSHSTVIYYRRWQRSSSLAHWQLATNDFLSCFTSRDCRGYTLLKTIISTNGNFLKSCSAFA